MKKERNSNFELLRILSIIMVIISHFCLFSGIAEQYPIMSVQSVLISSLRIGVVANYIFIIITGYFMVNSQVKYEKIISLFFETVFYSVTIFLVLKLSGIIEITNIQMIKSFLPIFFGNWFVIYYILLYLLIPYLNKFIKSINKNEFQKLLILLFMLNFLIPTLTNNVWNYTYHDFFITSYFIGAYIKLYCDGKYKNNRKIFLLILCGIIFGISSVYILQFLGEKMNIISFLNKPEYFIRNSYSFFPLIMGVLLVLFFRNIKIKNNVIINYFSSSTLGIYLIHENFLIRELIWKKLFIIELSNNIFILLAFLIIKVAIVYIVCLAIDKIRILLLQKIIDKYSTKLRIVLFDIKKRFCGDMK